MLLVLIVGFYIWIDEENAITRYFDTVVVGSGYGGSVAALRMAMAGIKLCLLEKGRQWGVRHCPADSLKLMSAVRMENRNVGFSFSPKDDLFQVILSSFMLYGCFCKTLGRELGNAGVMLPTPVRAKRNPKWPKECETDWDKCEASAAAMLRIQCSCQVSCCQSHGRTGVFGTNEILFQSQMRGLKLSEALGSGFSCNGNTVAYLAGSPALPSSYVLDRKEIPEKPFQLRPGPAISSSYTSSLGFAIQTAVLPTAYPYLLFKGITTYGWPTDYWLFHGIIDKLKHFIGFNSSQAMMLNAIGYNESDGQITFEKSTNKSCFSPPQNPLRPHKIKAFQKLTKKFGGIIRILINGIQLLENHIRY
ncbi:4Fe-4S ferredoxin, iron-sulfur binding, conserved site-containing protein [Melia azedarach]|uniref:4Fe-4S ferredoxin, iron-sulfur binding, conserved site-containing protein n=1 Tax=Melia azedarach TaxID=155640 RepID=A0ACC1X2C9_MELAZ|nr:4Fe-4S ferredoxin, iron-sulfur binding, conserved site-containing protein [Melia azedarach]